MQNTKREVAHMVDMRRLPTLAALAEIGVAHIEHENAAALLARAEAQAPDFLAAAFPDREAAFRTLRAEVAYLHQVIHEIRVEMGRVQEHDADAFTITAVSRISGVPLRDDDDGASWRARVHEVLPGIMDYLSSTPEGRDAKLDRAVRDFRAQVRDSRVRLIGCLLLCLVTPLLHTLLGMFGHPNPEFADLTDMLLKLSALPMAAMVYFSVRIRRIYASAEASPIWL